jgi:hypothetical protein
MRFAAAVAPISLWLGSCASGGADLPATSANELQECAARLTPRSELSSQRVTRAVSAPPVSRLVLNAELPLTELRDELEARVERRLAAAEGVGIGPAGVLNYRVERGPLALSVQAGALVVEAPVNARAEACRRGSCYASCAPEGIARVELPLRLTRDYAFQRSRVSVRFMRGCKVRLLGGLLSVDVTPTLNAQLAPELENAARRIDRELPELRSQLEVAWRELSRVHALPLGSCATLQPSGVVQGPITGNSAELRVRFAIEGRPELKTSCASLPHTATLPPLQFDASLAEEELVTLGLTTPLAALEPAFTTTAGVAGRYASIHIASARVAAAGPDVDAELQLAGSACGSVKLRSQLDFRGDGRFIALTAGELDASDGRRVSDAGLEPEALARSLTARPKMAPLLAVASIPDAVPLLAASLSHPLLAIQARVSSARAAGAVARGDELVAWVELRGAVTARHVPRAALER